jgi:hypothetical protein
MSELKKKDLEKVVSAISKSNRKFISLDDLSLLVGLFPEILGSELAYFEPMILMDSTLNTRDLLVPIKDYLASQNVEKEKAPASKRVVASAKEMKEFPTIASFIYARMTSAGGLFDPSAHLSDHDLHLLQKLVAREVRNRRSDARKLNKKKS